MTGDSHFVQRWRERGDGSNVGLELMRRLRKAIAEGDDNVAEYVFTVPEGPLYRFWSDAGRVFYCGVQHGWPATVLTQGMLRRIRDNRRRAKGRRARVRRNFEHAP